MESGRYLVVFFCYCAEMLRSPGYLDPRRDLRIFLHTFSLRLLSAASRERKTTYYRNVRCPIRFPAPFIRAGAASGRILHWVENLGVRWQALELEAGGPIRRGTT